MASFRNSFKYHRRLLHSSPLEKLHLEAKGQLGNFHGWNLPMQYSGFPIKESAKYTRSYCSLFDVSHMLQTRIQGPNAWKLIHNLTVADVRGLTPHTGTLTLFTMKNGGIQDDLIINKLEDDNNFYVVSNCARADVDLPLLLNEAKSLGDVEVSVIKNSLVALQGPEAENILQKLVDVDLSSMVFMQATSAKIDNINCRITRCGYTGEDGFEISVDHPSAVETLLKSDDKLKWAGLAERDILRLEGGMCLYGNDISESTTPYSARLLWTIAKARRAAADFKGADKILQEISNKSPESNSFRVGLVKETAGRAIRAGMEVYADDLKTKIGTVTSGSPSANVQGVESVGQAYIQKGFHQNGKSVVVTPKGKKPTSKNSVVISKMPFVTTKYKVQK